MFDLNQLIEKAIAGIGGAGLLGWLAYLFGKWIEKREPAEVREARRQKTLIDQAQFLRRELDAQARDLEAVRAALSDCSRVNFKLRQGLHRVALAFPEVAEVVEKILDEIDAGARG